MKYITDYQLDIKRGFQCKVNEKFFDIWFSLSSNEKSWFISDKFEKLLIELELDLNSVIKSYGTLGENHLVYCDSKQQCYNLCQYIVDTYFKPDSFTKNDEEFTVEIYGEKHTFFLTKNGMFYWDSKTIAAYHFNDHISLTEVNNICYILKINKYKQHNGKIGFETKEDAIKFAKYIIQYHYPRKETKERCDKSRRYLAKYYSDDEGSVILDNVEWRLMHDIKKNIWYFYDEVDGFYNKYFTTFIPNLKEVLDICSKLGFSAQFTQKLEFNSRQDAIKFTDYLIETYIIKKEKTYDTNRLRKERTSLSRGAKPAGSIIHGRRSKASVRCRHIEYKARIGC